MSMNLMLRRVAADDSSVEISANKKVAVPSLKIFDAADCNLDASEDFDLDFGEDTCEALFSGGSDVLSLEKAWHGLHYLLAGDVWGGSGHRAFLLMGGTEQGEDFGYGPPRYFDPQEVRSISNAINGISDDDLWSNFDANQMTTDDIYPGIWDEPEDDLQEEYLDYFHMLKKFLTAAAEKGEALQIMMM